jgi:hypothetical protein
MKDEISKNPTWYVDTYCVLISDRSSFLSRLYSVLIIPLGKPLGLELATMLRLIVVLQKGRRGERGG